jgi:hypothetical protein
MSSELNKTSGSGLSPAEDTGGAPADGNSETTEVELLSTQLLRQILDTDPEAEPEGTSTSSAKRVTAIKRYVED